MGEQGGGAWVAPPPRAALATTAMKLGMWALVACGPAALVAAATGPAPASGRAAAAAMRSPTGPSGFAELYIAAYLRAGSGDTALKAFLPQAQPISTPAGQRVASRTVATAAREVSPGYWSITVAADVLAKDRKGNLTPVGVHHFTAGILALGDATGGGTRPAGTPASFVATALPAQVAAPAPADAPDLAYQAYRQISSGPLADTVRQFTAAYLTGAGDLARYLTPGTPLQAVTPAPYQQINLHRIVVTGGPNGIDTTVPADRTTVRLLATLEVTDASGQRWPLSYALTVTARAGRWEVSALDPAPALDSARAPRPTQQSPGSTSASAGTPTPSGSVPTASPPPAASGPPWSSPPSGTTPPPGAPTPTTTR